MASALLSVIKVARRREEAAKLTRRRQTADPKADDDDDDDKCSEPKRRSISARLDSTRLGSALLARRRRRHLEARRWPPIITSNWASARGCRVRGPNGARLSGTRARQRRTRRRRRHQHEAGAKRKRPTEATRLDSKPSSIRAFEPSRLRGFEALRLREEKRREEKSAVWLDPLVG